MARAEAVGVVQRSRRTVSLKRDGSSYDFDARTGLKAPGIIEWLGAALVSETPDDAVSAPAIATPLPEQCHAGRSDRFQEQHPLKDDGLLGHDRLHQLSARLESIETDFSRPQ